MTFAGTLQRLAAAATADPRADGELLTRFVRSRDEAAFAEIFRRHGPLVYGVCRRALGNGPDADDAFQAVFLVLVRSAAAVRPPGMVGNWLHGVAVRTARRARAMAVRRVLREGEAAARRPEPTVEPDAETLTALDAELAALPDVYRAVVLACDRNGRSRAAAAKELGWPEGTVATRLAKGRQLLADRLRRRGLTLAGGAAVVGVPRALAAETLAAAHELITTGTAGVAPAVLQLTNEVVSAMTRTKLNVFAIGLAAAVLMTGGLGVWRGGESSAAPVPKVKDDGLIWTHNANTNALTAYTPDGKEAKTVRLPEGVPFLGLTPDGTRMAFGGKSGKASKDADGLTLHVGAISETCEGEDIGLGCKPADRFVWSPDVKQVVRVRLEKPGPALGRPGEKPSEYSNTLYDLAGKKETVVALPVGHKVMGWSADGKTWRVQHANNGADPKLPFARWLTTPVGGKGELTPVCDTASFYRLVPDGPGFVGVGWKHGPNEFPGEHKLFRVADGKETVLAQFEAGMVLANVALAPDGRRVVCAKLEADATGDPNADTAFVLFDADGKNETRVVRFEKDRQATHLLGWFPTSAPPANPKAKPPQREPIKAPVPKAKAGDEQLLITSWGGKTPFLLVSPDGKSQEGLPVPDGVEPRTVRVSPDGRWAVYGELVAKDGMAVHGHHPCRVRVLDLQSPDAKPRTLLDEAYGESVSWAADGQAVFVSRYDPERIAAIRGQTDGLIPMTTTRITLADGKETPVPLPDGHRAVAVSPDGGTWLTHTTDVSRYTIEAFVVTTKDGKVDKTSAVGTTHILTQLSADGERAMCVIALLDPGQPHLAWVDLATKKVNEIKPPDGVKTGWIGFARWSADGKRMAFAWSERVRDRKGTLVDAHRVTVCDADGGNPVTAVELEPGAGISGIDWVPARPVGPKAKRPDAEVFVGTWEAMVPGPGGQPWEKATWVIDEKLALRIESPEVGGRFTPWPLTLSPEQTPKGIDLGKFKGIYELDGDEIRVAYRVSGDRPTTVDPAPGVHTYTLRRVEPKKVK